MSGPIAPACDVEAEEAVLGALLLAEAAPKLIDVLRMEVGLNADSFYRAKHSTLWEAITKVADREARTDVGLVAGWLDDVGALKDLGGRAAVEAMTAASPSSGNVRHYAERIVELWRWRQAATSTYHQQAAITDRDWDAFHAAAAMADTTTHAGARHTDPKVLGEVLLQRKLEPKAPPLPLPWAHLARDGMRLRPGQTTVLSGWTSMGKSHVAVELAEAVAASGGHVVIWTNEMTEDELVARVVQRKTGIDANRVLDGELTAEEEAWYDEVLRNLPFGIQECFGWPAEEVARHVRLVAPSLAVVDHFHQLPGSAANDTAEPAVIALTTAARQAASHLVLVAQLNRGRDIQGEKPAPTLRDLRSTAALESLPNNVLFFHRDQHAEEVAGQPDRWVVDATGVLHLAKQRGGRRDLMQPVVFNDERLTIRERAFTGAIAA